MKSPSLVKLERTYAFAETFREKAETIAPEFWSYLTSVVPFQADVAPLKDVELADVIHDRFFNYLFSRLIEAGCQALANAPNDEDKRYEILEEAIDGVVDVVREQRTRIAWYLFRICPKILGKSAELTTAQLKEIRAFANENLHRCYICGWGLHFETRPFGLDTQDNIAKKREARKFEAEHVWSQARGGSRHRSNIAAGCHQCNGIKKHLISYADLQLEQIVTAEASDESLKRFMTKEFKFALYWRQSGACSICSEKFYAKDTEEVFLARKEPTRPYYFFNMMMVCADCNATSNLEGVKIREGL